MIVVNLYAGPGSGKSTTCAGVFSKLKLAGVNCEMALEYAKDKVWEKSFNVLENQIYVFGKQLHKLWRLKDQVDVVITDSPLLLSLLYYSGDCDSFRRLVVDQYNSFNNVNYFIKRDGIYNPNGRMQTEDESKELDRKLNKILDDHSIDYVEVNKQEAIDLITKNILKLIKQ